MNLYVLRHGQTDYNIEGKFQGQIDINLNKNGILQINEVAKELIKINFDVVFSSPLKRAMQTAKIVTKKEIQIDDRLIERNFGLLEGRKSINDYESKIDKYNIETIESLKSRVFDFLNQIMKKKHEYENVLIVTHACIARMIESYIYNKCYEEVNKNYVLLNGDYKKYTI